MTYATFSDAYDEALARAFELQRDGAGIVGYGVAHLFDSEGRTKELVPFANTITDAGDTYYATRGAAAVNANGVAQPTVATGMQIGSGSTAVSKSGGTGITLGSYLYGQAFDATFPTVTAIGTNLGTQIAYKATYAAGNGTGTVSEAAIVNGTVSTTNLAAANVLSRTVFAGITKGAADTLAITWNHKFLGA
jgi:hypothetical protein